MVFKKLTVFIIIVISIVSLCACSANDTDSPENETTEAVLISENPVETEETEETASSSVSEDIDETGAATETEEPKQIVYQDDLFTITYEYTHCYSYADGENMFEFYFTVENRSNEDIIVSSVDPILDGYAFHQFAFEISVPAGQEATGCVGFADHDDWGSSEYMEWLENVAENGLKTLSQGFSIRSSQGSTLIEATPTVEISLY